MPRCLSSKKLVPRSIAFIPFYKTSLTIVCIRSQQRIYANPVSADMQSVTEAITALTAHVTAATTQVQTLATAARNNETTTTTASTFAMTPGHFARHVD